MFVKIWKFSISRSVVDSLKRERQQKLKGRIQQAVEEGIERHILCCLIGQLLVTREYCTLRQGTVDGKTSDVRYVRIGGVSRVRNFERRVSELNGRPGVFTMVKFLTRLVKVVAAQGNQNPDFHLMPRSAWTCGLRVQASGWNPHRNVDRRAFRKPVRIVAAFTPKNSVPNNEVLLLSILP